MNIKYKTIIALISSFLVFAAGTFALFTNALPAMAVIVSYIFAITGGIGVIANCVMLRKLKAIK